MPAPPRAACRPLIVLPVMLPPAATPWFAVTSVSPSAQAGGGRRRRARAGDAAKGARRPLTAWSLLSTVMLPLLHVAARCDAAGRRHVPSAGSQQPHGRHHHQSSQGHRADEPGCRRRAPVGRRREMLRRRHTPARRCSRRERGPLGHGLVAGFARKQGRLVGLEADALDAPEELVARRRPHRSRQGRRRRSGRAGPRARTGAPAPGSAGRARSSRPGRSAPPTRGRRSARRGSRARGRRWCGATACAPCPSRGRSCP